MKLNFFTPSKGVPADAFGAATFGFVGAENEREATEKAFPEELQGLMVSGTYAECLAAIPEGQWQAGIVVLGNAGGENEFIHALAQKVRCPLTGGGAAIDPETGKAGLITGERQAAVFLIADDRYAVQVTCQNIHQEILGEVDVAFTDPRVIDAIEGQEPLAWLNARRAELGLAETDFEHMTLSDKLGVNAHLSLADGRICSGRDLQPRMLLRHVPADQVQPRMRAFYDDPNAIVFGCAGLKGILPGKLGTDSLGLFLFGEVCTKDGQSEFGNLMLSKIQINKR